MSVSRVTAKNSKAEFWRVVVECLREFHKIAADERGAKRIIIAIESSNYRVGLRGCFTI